MRLWNSVKRGLRRFYSAWEAYINAAVKFLLSCLTLWGILLLTGSHPLLGQPAAVVLVAAACSILPANALILAAAVYLEAGYWQSSMTSGLVGGVLLLVALLFYFCFISGQAFVVVCTGLSLGLGLPFCVPVACGLMRGPGSVVGISLGTAVYFVSSRLIGAGGETQALGEEMLDSALELFGTVCLDREMLMTLVILSVVCLVVYLIRRMPIPHCWMLGTGAGALVYGIFRGMELLLIGAVSLPLLAVDLLLGIGTGLVLSGFCFALDYRKVQYLQFEDDEYYYYVKAVPKLDPLTEDGAEDPENPAVRAKKEMT